MIDVDGLTKRFGAKVAVDHLSFSVRSGVVTGFLGPNASGKSTTMRCMLGLDRPDGGMALFDGKPYRTLTRPLATVGSLLDAGYLHPGRSATNHLRWLAASNGFSRRRVDEVLELVGLASVAGTRVRGFSLGMRQRLGIAAALLGNPQTLLLDEPANGLDPEGIRWIRDLLSHLAGQGATVLVSSHQLSEIALIASDLVVIGQGKLIEQSTVADFVERHAERWVRVRTPQAARMAELLTAAGIDVEHEPDSALLDARGTTSEQVGELAAKHGVVLHELSPQTGSLEDAFLSATADAVVHRSGSVVQGGAS